MAYVLANKVTHARLQTLHAFTYPTVALLVSLDALERSALDLPVAFGLGYVFRFGSTWRTLVALRGNDYLARERTSTPVSIRARLDRVLMDRGAIAAPADIRDAWMMTMPAMCGFEGINPLTVYYCYRPSGELFLVVLEVHNTFGEGHVYVLELGKDEDPLPPRGYHHQWTIPRRFFVSPFNDRSGFYTVAITSPSHSPFDPSPRDPPKPTVRIQLRMPGDDATSSAVGPLKLVACLTPQHSAPLSTRNLLGTLFHFPLALFITLPRILYEAWRLHYRKRLPIFARPEPFPAWANWDTHVSNETDITPKRDYPGGVFSQSPTLLERYARQRTLAFLERRAADTGIDVMLLPGDPSEKKWFRATQQDGSPTLTLSYTSPCLFTLFLLAPCAHLLFRAGCRTKTDGERPLLNVSDHDAYFRIFEPVGRGRRERWLEQATQRMRLALVPREIVSDCDGHHHPLVVHPSSWMTRLLDLLVIIMLVLQDVVMEKVYGALRVRFVPGTEPWLRAVWRRAGPLDTTEIVDSRPRSRSL